MLKEQKVWRATVLTLFPTIFPGTLGVSCVGRARMRGVWSLRVVDVRDYAHNTDIDDAPYGGGAGMVLRADVVSRALDAAHTPGHALVCLTPAGVPLTQKRVQTLAGGEGVTLVCGRFEGIDQRVVEARQCEEISVGDFVCAGGELAAMLLVEAAVRLLPGVVGAPQSLAHESFGEDGLLEHPHYTRPRLWEGRAVPAVLLSGDHARIAHWRRTQAEKRTQKRRPDLWKQYKP